MCIQTIHMQGLLKWFVGIEMFHLYSTGLCIDDHILRIDFPFHLHLQRFCFYSQDAADRRERLHLHKRLN